MGFHVPQNWGIQSGKDTDLKREIQQANIWKKIKEHTNRDFEFVSSLISVC